MYTHNILDICSLNFKKFWLKINPTDMFEIFYKMNVNFEAVNGYFVRSV
jgi:hypothetical protein